MGNNIAGYDLIQQHTGKYLSCLTHLILIQPIPSMPLHLKRLIQTSSLRLMINGTIFLAHIFLGAHPISSEPTC